MDSNGQLNINWATIFLKLITITKADVYWREIRQSQWFGNLYFLSGRNGFARSLYLVLLVRGVCSDTVKIYLETKRLQCFSKQNSKSNYTSVNRMSSLLRVENQRVTCLFFFFILTSASSARTADTIAFSFSDVDWIKSLYPLSIISNARNTTRLDWGNEVTLVS